LITVPKGTTDKNCGVKVNASNGTVTTTAKATPGKYTIQAVSTDGSSVRKNYSFTVVSYKIKNITLATTSSKVFRTTNGFGSSKSAKIKYTIGVENAASSTCIKVTSSNPDILTVKNSLSGKNGTVTVTATGNGTGTANVIIESTDGTNLKKTCKVTVCNPPSGLRIAAPSGSAPVLAKGKVMALQSVVETGFGKIDAASKKLKWTSSNSKVVSVDANGRIKALDDSGKMVTITASATDGSGLKATYEVYTGGKITSLEGYLYTSKGLISAKKASGNMEVSTSTVLIVIPKGTGVFSQMYTVSVSKEGMGVGRYYAGDTIAYIPILANEKGSYTVTVKCTDGNTASTKFNIIVK